MIGYPSGQGGPSLATRDFPRWSRKKNLQACSIKMAWCWPRSFLRFFTFSTCSIFSDLARISLVSNAKNFMSSSIYLNKMRTNYKPACTPICRARTLRVGDLGALSRPPPPPNPSSPSRNAETLNRFSIFLPLTPRDLASARFICVFFVFFASLCFLSFFNPQFVLEK